MTVLYQMPLSELGIEFRGIAESVTLAFDVTGSESTVTHSPQGSMFWKTVSWKEVKISRQHVTFLWVACKRSLDSLLPQSQFQSGDLKKPRN